MLMRIVLFFILCALPMWPFDSAYSAQLDMKAAKSGNMTQFSYKFEDFSGRPVSLSFMLNTRQLNAGAGQFQAFDQVQMENYTMEYLHYYAAQTPGVQVSVDKIGDTISFHVMGPSDEVVQQTLAQMKRRNEEAQDRYLQSKYFIKDTTGKYIMPDHIRIAENYIASMRPVAKAIAAQSADKSQRGVLNASLNFLQSIPYDTLQNRATSNGSGFTTPYGMLLMNRGDCDTKSVALIAMMRSLYPNMPIAMIYTNNHAFVGFQVQALSGDRILTVERKVFVLTEPAGPGQFPVGRIGHVSSADLDRDYFSYVMMP